MKLPRIRVRWAFSSVLGLTDGILTALTLGAGRMMQSHGTMSVSLAVRIAMASALTGGVVFFTAELARRNRELVRAEQELNLLSRGRLAATRLGRFNLLETSQATVTLVVSNFAGAFLPLIVVTAFRQLAWIPILLSMLLLWGLGWLIARVTYRSRIRWSFGLMAAGAILTAFGMWLHIV